MPRILVSNNSELLRHLLATPFRRLGLDITVAANGDEAATLMRERPVDLAILDAEMPGLSGYDVAQNLSKEASGCRVVLVMGKRISAAQLQRAAQSGCDEVLIAPMSADELYDVVTIQLGLTRHGQEPYSVDVVEIADDGPRPLSATVTNLSVDGARLLTQEPVAEGTELGLSIRFEDHEAAPLELGAHAVWVQPSAGETLIGASFDELTSEQRARLSEVTKWQIIDDTERARIVMKGDITEAVNLEELLPNVVGRISFDMSQVRYMNSLGVRTWVEFLERANAQGYEFHACSISFVLQASTVKGVLGRGTVVSFFAPYACASCEHQEERLLQSATVLAAGHKAPTFACPECNGAMELDDVPERYFSFLFPDSPDY